VVDQLTQSQPGVTTVQALSDTTVNGVGGFTATVSFANQGTPEVSALYFFFSGDTEYQLTLQSAEKRWQELQPEMQTVLGSFTSSA
jgi:hypothetical protein